MLAAPPRRRRLETKDDWECRSYTKVVTRVKWIGALVIVLVIGGIRVVDETEVGVVKTFGEISGTVDSGLNFINPLTQKVTMYDLRVHVRESSFASYTKDAQPLTAAIEYQYALNPAFAEAAIAQAKGEAEALQNMPDTWVQQLYLEKWDGKLPTFMTSDNAGIFPNPKIDD